MIILTLVPGYVVLVLGGGWATLSGSTSIEDQMPIYYRLLGLYAFHFLTFQISLGAFMRLYGRFFNPRKVFKFHIFNGVFTYLLSLLHPLIIYISLYQAAGLGGIMQTSTIFVGPPWGPIAVLLAQVALLLMTTTLISGFMRNRFKYWRQVHWLNYVIFILIFIKSLILGTDTKLPIMNIMYIIYGTIVAAALLYRFLPRISQRRVELT